MGGKIFLGGHLNYGKSTIHIKNPEFNFDMKGSGLLGLSLNYLIENNFVCGFGVSREILRAARNKSVVDLQLDYLLMNFSFGKLFSKTHTSISAGPFIGLLLKRDVFSPNAYLNGVIQNSFNKTDFGIAATIEHRLYSKNRFEVGLNCGSAVGLADIYKDDIYPLGGWNSNGSFARTINIFFGLNFQFEPEK